MSTPVERMMREVEALSLEDRLRLAGRIIETVLPTVTKEPKEAFADLGNRSFRNVRGKYRDLLPSSDEIARRKQDEIDLEDRSDSDE